MTSKNIKFIFAAIKKVLKKTFAKTPRPYKTASFVLGVLCASLFWFLSSPSPSYQATGHTASLEGALLAAGLAEQQDRPDISAHYYARAHALQPADRVIGEKLFLAYLAAGELDAAQKQAEKLVRQTAPVHRMVRLMLAAQAIKNNRPASAIRQMDTLAATGAEDFSILLSDLVTQWAHFAAGDNDKAAAIATRLAEGAHFKIVVNRNLALLYEAMGEKDLAYAAHARVIAAGGLSVSAFVVEHISFLHRMDDKPALQNLFAKIDMNEQTHPIYVRLKRMVQTKPPAFKVTPRMGLASMLAGLAQTMRRDLGHQHIAPYVQIAAWLVPEEVPIQMMIGELAAIRKDYDKALEIYNRFSDDPLYGSTISISFALILEEQGRLDEALEKLHALSVSHAGEFVEKSLADMYQRAERYAQAEPIYTALIERLEKSDRADWNLFFSRGMVRERMDKWQEAEADLLRAKELSNNNAYVLNYLGYSWIDHGINLHEGLDIIEQAVEKQPRNGFFVDSLGWALYRLGDFVAAVRLLEKASELEPLDAEIIDHLGDALWQAGRKFEARYQWQRALGLDPDDDKRRLIEQKIETGLTAKHNAPTKI